MGAVDVTALAAVLKQRYDLKALGILGYEESPLYAMLEKKADTEFGGANAAIPLRYALPQGGSANFGTALATVTATAYQRFVITRRTDYMVSLIQNEAIRAGKGDENAIIETLSTETDNLMKGGVRSLSISLYRNGGGQRGQISAASNVNTNTITLTNLGDFVQFEDGMTLQVAVDDGTGGAGVLAGTAVLQSMDHQKATLTLATTWAAAFPGVGVNYYIFRAGDYNVVPQGLLGWLPTVAPGTNDNWFGVNRSLNTTRLAGLRVVGNGAPIEETLIQSAELLGIEKAKPDLCLMNNYDVAQLVKALGQRVIYDRVESIDEPDIGFKAVVIDRTEGYADPHPSRSVLPARHGLHAR